MRLTKHPAGRTIRDGMRPFISRCLALSVLLAGTGYPVGAEDLDAALAAQKKKAERRVYSDHALIENHALEVPRSPTEEERALDQKLREIEAKADSQAASLKTMPPRAVSDTPQQSVENKNWLTPAALDDTAEALSNQVEDAWLTRELERQKEAKELGALQKEQARADKLLKEKAQPQTTLPELERIKTYQIPPSILPGSGDRTANTPAYMLPQSGTPDPLAAIRPTPKKEQPVAPPIFSPEAARLSSQLDKDPLRSTKSSYLTPNLGMPAPAKSSSVFSPGLNQPETPAPLTPMQMIKKSSPINRPNPFAEDHMPQIKGSIWD